jgi:methylated-DNA-[protein]-cysteine S-methyltransferase
MALEWTTYDSPIGPLALVECPDGPLVVEFPRRAGRLRWAERVSAHRGPVTVSPGPCQATTALLDRYFGGHPDPFPWPAYLGNWLPPTPNQEAVWRAICAIPFGETRSYQEVATAAGLRARAAGQLVGANHLAILIPCHRVVGSDGSLVGYGGGLARKRRLLNHELRVAGVRLT